MNFLSIHEGPIRGRILKLDRPRFILTYQTAMPRRNSRLIINHEVIPVVCASYRVRVLSKVLWPSLVKFESPPTTAFELDVALQYPLDPQLLIAYFLCLVVIGIARLCDDPESISFLPNQSLYNLANFMHAVAIKKHNHNVPA